MIIETNALMPPAAQGSAADDEPAAVTTGEAQGGQYPFAAMKLKVGDRIQLQLPEVLSRDRVIVRLIGYVSNVSLLVTMPRAGNGLRLDLLEDDSVVARVFSSQNAFGFSASVAKVIKLPFEYLHLSYPEKVTGVVIRKAPRVRTKIICSVEHEHAKDDGHPGLLSNLSANGAQLDSRRALAAKGEKIRLSFRIKLHAVDTTLSVNATVRSQYADESTDDERSGFVHHGLEFFDLQPNDTLVLQSLVYQQMIEQPHTVL